jgi:hypothetical protein
MVVFQNTDEKLRQPSNMALNPTVGRGRPPAG